MLKKVQTGRVLTLTLDRPEKRNALNNELVTLLKSALIEAKLNLDLKVIVINQSGKVFSAGADLESLQQLQKHTYEENVADSKHLAELFELIYTHELPIISAIEGDAIAGGCGLATVCDISLAVETAKFGYTETRIGFIPAIVSYFVAKKIGDMQARRLLLGGELINADEAYEVGLITEVCTKNDFAERLTYWIQTFETKVSRNSVSATKQLLKNVQDLPFAEFLDYATEMNAKARESDDCKRGISAFLTKEKISW